MTDHAESARKILTGTDTPPDPETSRAAHHQGPSAMELREATVHALLDIAAAIRESGVTPRCLALSYANRQDQCILGRDHDGQHETQRGFRWRSP